MIGYLISWLARNPLIAALGLVAALFAATAGVQKLANIKLELTLARAEGRISALEAAERIHHSEREALSEALREQSRAVDKWRGEADKRREAAILAARRAESDAYSAQIRIKGLREAVGDDCEVAVSQIREALGV